jgi:hypothetical protein
MGLFRRPTIYRCRQDQLYAAQRLLLDAEAKRDHALMVAGHHEVNVRMLQKQIDRINQELQDANHHD